ncbi:hypothetical protein B0H10DRAFT_1949008 [Mycena sp. CBHHK59/15]|nr:hypothetical protein B0H10DRAFT_1949008 [Mycena sp. CBHHK59/15]
MSSTHSTANPELGDTSADASGPRSSLFGKPIAVSATFAEQGLQAFSEEQGDGGIPSSPAFAAEQAVDDQRFAALDLETRDQAVSLSSQMKRDFLLAQAAPVAPPGFATGPSNATRLISRSASMAGEVVDSPVEVPVDDGDATPLILANHKEAGQKEKAEAPGAGAARANGNMIRIGGQFITLVARVEKAERRAEGDARACQSRHRNNNVGKLEDKIELVGAQSRNGIENLESRIKLLTTGASSDARVGLHTSQIAQLTGSLDTVKRALERLTSTFICDDDGVPIKQFATQGDIAGLWDSIQEGFDGHDAVVEERLAPTIQKVNGAASLVAKLEAAVAKLETHDTKREQELLAARENIAGLRIDLAAALNASKLSGSAVTVAPAAAAAAPPAEVRSTGFSIGGKKLKRKASVELGASRNQDSSRAWAVCAKGVFGGNGRRSGKEKRSCAEEEEENERKNIDKEKEQEEEVTGKQVLLDPPPVIKGLRDRGKVKKKKVKSKWRASHTHRATRTPPAHHRHDGDKRESSAASQAWSEILPRDDIPPTAGLTRSRGCAQTCASRSRATNPPCDDIHISTADLHTSNDLTPICKNPRRITPERNMRAIAKHTNTQDSRAREVLPATTPHSEPRICRTKRAHPHVCVPAARVPRNGQSPPPKNAETHKSSVVMDDPAPACRENMGVHAPTLQDEGPWKSGGVRPRMGEKQDKCVGRVWAMVVQCRSCVAEKKMEEGMRRK